MSPLNNRTFSFPYSTDYDPSMPVIEVGVSLPKYNTAEVTITALLDSGSDGTLLPVDLLESIGAKPIGPARIRGLWSSSRSASMYLVKLYVGPHQLFAVRVAGIESKDEPILGRNVLNQMVITHNGLAGMVEIVG